jgi:hypothetical protein
MKLGETYLVLNKGHLWVVITDPQSDGSVAMVSFTTKRANSDLNCVMNVGDHPFIRHETIVAYELARVLDPGQQKHVLANPSLSPPKAPVSSALLQRIHEGALVSDLTPQKIQKMVRETMKRLGTLPTKPGKA